MAAGRWARRIARGALPAAVRRTIAQRAPAALTERRRRAPRHSTPAVGRVRFGSLRRLSPVSSEFGYDRGKPIDRYYIEDFLARHGGPSGDVRGRVLEVGDDSYTRAFSARAGSASAVTKVDVLHVDEGNPKATIVADLTRADHVPSDAFDCIVCTQTLLLIYDVRAAVATLARILAPGGIALVTVPGISRVCGEIDVWGDYWRFTTLSARRLFEEAFPPANVKVEAYGNVLSAVSFLHGLSAGELRREELDLRDPAFEVLIGVRAVKGHGSVGS